MNLEIPESVKVYSLATINAAGAVPHIWDLNSVLSLVLKLAQLTVAVVTVIYTIKKIREKKVKKD